MADDFEVLTDHEGRPIRLTNERWQHIIDHPELEDQRPRVIETIERPDTVIQTVKDETVHAYQRFYETTPVTSKYLIVAVKMLEDDAFIITAYYSSRPKRGQVLWQK